jgi:predicted nucleotide-binding protein (sugar kinase/HSP70/actin superfamily)
VSSIFEKCEQTWRLLRAAGCESVDALRFSSGTFSEESEFTIAMKFLIVLVLAVACLSCAEGLENGARGEK